jgi:hypothetical protein
MDVEWKPCAGPANGSLLAEGAKDQPKPLSPDWSKVNEHKFQNL